MTPFASVAMLEKLALLKIALCKAPVFEQSLLASDLDVGSHGAGGFVENGGIVICFGHGRPPCKA